MLPRRMMMAAAGGGVATVSFATSAVSSANLTTYTFSSQSLGTPETDRKIVVAIAGADNTRTVSSVTVAGNTASFVQRQQHSPKTAELWQVDVPTGTTGDVVVTWSGGQTACGIGVYAVYGAAASAFDSGGATGDGGTGAANVELNIPAGGVVIAVCMVSDATITWSNVTEKYDEATEGGNSHSGASDEFAGAQTDLAITATPGDATTHLALVVASWGPA